LQNVVASILQENCSTKCRRETSLMLIIKYESVECLCPSVCFGIGRNC
jgi:hypothetical protein